MSNNPYEKKSSGEASDPSDDIPPPSGPPPPKVPRGWLAKWNEQYSAWYYVNLSTKKSQWESPLVKEEYSRSTPESERPPQYTDATGIGEHPSIPPTQGYRGNSPLPPRLASPPRSRSGSLSSKISKFLKSHSPAGSQRPTYYTPPPSHYSGVAPPQPMYHAPTPYYGGGYGAPMQSRRPKFGPGAAMGLGVGGGFLGGMMFEDAMGHHDQDVYQDGFQDGTQYDDDDGGYDGGDGGDFAGDFGDF